MMTRNRSKLDGDAPTTKSANGDALNTAKSTKSSKRSSTGNEADSTAKVTKKTSANADANGAVSDATSVYDFVVKDTFGNDVPLEKYKGQVLLIVNIASKCGHTKKNYDELNTLQEQYKGKDFKILSFPCNQFGHQMPQKDGDDMVCHLEKRNVNVGDLFQKIDVNGKNAAPLYTFLKQKQGDGANIKWNFVKFLVNKNGEPVERFASAKSPLQIVPNIDELLKK